MFIKLINIDSIGGYLVEALKSQSILIIFNVPLSGAKL
jgi:hypothetical protein